MPSRSWLTPEIAIRSPVASPWLTITSSPVSSPGAAELNDVREALSGLGYGAEEIQAAIKDLPLDGDASVLLKQALQKLAVNS